METMRLYKKYYIECYATEKEPSQQNKFSNQTE